MLFLLDTNAFSDLMNKNPKIDGRMANLLVTDRVVIRGEIQYGIERFAQGRRRRELETNAALLFAVIPCEPIPVEAGDHYATVKVRRQKLGLTMDEMTYGLPLLLWRLARRLSPATLTFSRSRD